VFSVLGADVVVVDNLLWPSERQVAERCGRVQAWKRRYVVLRDTWYCCSACVVTSLDIYDTEPPPAALLHHSGRHGDHDASSSSSTWSLDLRRLTGVGFHLDSRRFQYAFYVEHHGGGGDGGGTDGDDASTRRRLLFAAESDLEMRCWVAALRMLADKVNNCPAVASMMR